VSIVRLLLDWGADPNIPANGNMTALNVANENGNEDIGKIIAKCAIQSDMTTLESRITSIEHRQKNSIQIEEAAKVTTLIPMERDHPGAFSFFIDNFVTAAILEFLDDVWSILPVAPATDIKKKKNDKPCSLRYYFCDGENYLSKILSKSIASVLNKGDGLDTVDAVIFPHMRFLDYQEPGSVLAPHVDLYKVDRITGKRSTHTFILYLRDCDEGGETALLRELSPDGPSAQHEILAKVHPKRGRILLFPHACPHAGMEVISTPKLLLRGEVLIIQ